MPEFSSYDSLSYLGESQQQNPPLILANSAPGTNGRSLPLGARWLDRTTNTLYDLVAANTWQAGGNAPATTTAYGIVLLDEDGTLTGADNTTVPTSLAVKTYADALAIAGAPDASESVKGIAELATSAEATTGTDDFRIMTALKVAAVMAAPPAIGSGTPAAGSFTTLAASGLASLSGSATVLTGGTALNLGSDASGDAINLGTGAAARVITIGNVTGASQVVLNAGTAGIALASTGAGDITIDSDDTLLLDADGVLELNSSAGPINIGNDDIDQAINIGSDGERAVLVGSQNGAASLTLDSGTGALNVGTTIAKTVTVGNKTGASALVLDVGTGNFALNGVGASTYTVGAATTSGTIDIGGTAQTGTITLGDSSGTNIVQIGSGEGATTVAIAGGATAAKVVTIADGAVANLVTIGSASGAASLDLLCGTGNFSLEGATASTYDISATGVNTGTVTIAAGTGARTVNLATGGTGVKTVNIATAAIGNLVTIGTVTAAASLDLKCGTGNFTLEGATASTYDISSTGVNTGTVTIASGTGARTVELAGGGTGIKTINIGAAATADVITLGSTTGAGATNILAGSGGIVSSGPCLYVPDAITAASGGTAASVATVVTEITTNGDMDLDNVTLANGVDGQIKIFAVVAVGDSTDSVKITPASLIGGTQITFSANPLGLGCQMYYDAGAAGWIIVGNNGGVVA